MTKAYHLLWWSGKYFFIFNQEVSGLSSLEYGIAFVRERFTLGLPNVNLDLVGSNVGTGHRPEKKKKKAKRR